MMMTVTEKLAAIERELRYRRNCYPHWVEQGKMADKFAKTQIAIFEEIAEDYRALAAKERLL